MNSPFLFGIIILFYSIMTDWNLNDRDSKGYGTEIFMAAPCYLAWKNALIMRDNL